MSEPLSVIASNAPSSPVALTSRSMSQYVAQSERLCRAVVWIAVSRLAVVVAMYESSRSWRYASAAGEMSREGRTRLSEWPSARTNTNAR